MLARRAGASPRGAPAPTAALRAPGAPPASKSMAMEPAPMEAMADEAPWPEGGGGQTEDVLGRPAEPRAVAVEAASLDYSRLVMGAWSDRTARGRLVPDAGFEYAVGGVGLELTIVTATVMRVRATAEAALALPPPPGHVEAAPVDSFDYRYACAAPVDVPSGGRWSTVPVMQCTIGLEPSWVCVPAVDPAVYRTLIVRNSTPHALLPGPVDVSIGDEFLLTAPLPAVPPGSAEHRLGLGVEEGIKVSRKTQFREATGGFLGGSTVLPHELEIELHNRLATSARVEVRERVPVPRSDEKDVKVEEAAVTPPWERVEGPLDGAVVAGARRWSVVVPAGEKTTLVAQFAIRIPADRMLVGGNRRG